VTPREAVLSRLRMSPYEAAVRRVYLTRTLAADLADDNQHVRVRAFLRRLQLEFPHKQIGWDA
jgi:hypothetical protein